MAVLTPGVPLVSTEPVLSVDGLGPGTHRFRLEVVDEAGNRSLADEREVLVRAAVPVVTSIRPGWGEWGDSVRIVGSGFDPQVDKNQATFSDGVPSTASAGSTRELLVAVPQPAVTGLVTLQSGNAVATSPQPFIVPRHFDISTGGPPLLDLAAEPLRNEIWVLGGTTSDRSGMLTMVSLRRRGVVGTLEMQAGAREIAISGREQARAAISNSRAATVTLVDVSTRRVLSHVRVSPGPAGLAFQPGGQLIYVACSSENANGVSNTVDVITLEPVAPPRVLARIEMERGPARVVFSPDGKLAFVNEVGTGTVAMIDTSDHRVIDRFKVGGNETSAPSEVAVSDDTFPLLVANPGTRSCSVIDRRGQVRDLELGTAMAGAAIDTTGGWLSGPDEPFALALDLTTLRLRKVQAAGSGAGPKSIVVVPSRAPGVVIASAGAAAVSVMHSPSKALQAVARQSDRRVRGVLSADGAMAAFIGGTAPTLGVLELASVLLL